MIVWLLIGGGGVLAVVAIALGLSRAKDRYLPQHAVVVPGDLPGDEISRVGDVAGRAFRGSMILAEERTFLLPSPGPLEAPIDDWTGPLLEKLHEPGRRPRGMTEPDDLEPGAGPLSPGYNSHLPSNKGSVVKADSPVPDDGAGDESEPCGVTAPPAPEDLDGSRGDLWQESFFVAPVQPDSGLGMGFSPIPSPEPSRLLRTTGEIMRADLLADVCADIARRDAEVAVWMASFAERWAVA